MHGFSLLNRYSRNQDFLSTEDLTLFLEAEQGVNEKNKRSRTSDMVGNFSFIDVKNNTGKMRGNYPRI